MRLDRDDVVATGEQGGRDEDLGDRVRGSRVARRGVGAGRVADGASVDARAVNLGAVDVDDGTIVGQVLDGDTLEGARVGHLEVRAEVGGHGARDVGRKDGGDAGVTVAQGRGAGGPLGIIERGLGPVLGSRTGLGAVAPRGARIQQDRVRRINLALGRGHVDRGGRGAVARRVDSAHEEAVVAAARNLNGSRGRGGDRAIVAQDLVGNCVGNTVPRQGHGLRSRGRGTHERRGLGRDVVAVVEAGEAAVPLRMRGVDVGQVEVAADPQVAVGVGRQGPRAGLTLGGELEGRPMQVLAGGGIPRADPLDLVDARPAVGDGPVVLVLVGTVGAVAGRIDDALGGDGAGLHVAAHAQGHRAGGALVRLRVVAEQGVLGTADEDATTSGRDGLLVLAGAHGGGLEVEARILRGAGLRGELGGVPGALGAMRTGEVSTGVEGTVVLTDANGLHGTTELGVPAAVGARIQGNARRVAAVDAGAAAAAQVGEHATHVHVAVVVVKGAHAHQAAADGVPDGQVPRGVNLPGGGVDRDGADVGLAVDAREVAGHEEATVGQHEEGLNLVIEVEGLAGPVAGIDVEGGQAARGGLGAIFTLLDPGEVAAHVHGGADLRQRLNLDRAFGVGAVDVTGNAPRGLGRVVGHGAGHGGPSNALVGDGGEGVRGDARTHVGLGVGEDRLPVLVEEGGRRAQVTGPARRAGAVAPAHRPAGATRRVDLQSVPTLVVTQGVPQEAGDGSAAIHRETGRVGHLEGPHEVRHLGELQVQLLVGTARSTPGTQDANAVRLILDVLMIEEIVDRVIGELNDVEGVGVALAGGQFGGIALADTPRFPAFTAAADHDPATAVRGLVTEELSGGIHRGGLQPVGAVLRVGVALLDVPARCCGGCGAEAIMNNSLTRGNRGLITIIGVRHRRKRKGGTRNNRRRRKGYKARKCGSHDTTFQGDNNLLHQ